MNIIGVISLTKYPVPAVKGGAVETLVTTLLDANEKNTAYRFHVISFYDKASIQTTKKYVYSRFFLIKKNFLQKSINKIICLVYKIFGIKGSLYYLKIKKLLKKYPVDILILEASSQLSFLLKKDFPTIPIIQHLHNIPEGMFLKSNRWGVSSDGYMCVSRFIARKCIEKIRINEDKLDVLYNSVDTNLFRPVFNDEEKIALRKKAGLLSSDFIVIFSGRIQPYKGVKELLQGFCRLHDTHIKLLVVGASFFSESGNGSFLKKLKLIAKNCEGNIVFTGYVSHEKIREYYQMADIAVLPSMWEEPFGLTCLEAISCGLPVVITNSGGMPEIIDDKCGFVLERDETLPGKIAEHIKLLKENICMRKAMATAARERSSHFSIQIYWEHFQKIIDTKYL